MTVSVQKARKVGSGRPMWMVLGDDCLPIQPIDEFLTFHDVTGSSPNTIRAYAHHLKLYWEYLTEADLDWRTHIIEGFLGELEIIGWDAKPVGLPSPEGLTVY